MITRIKICCISSVEEAGLAVSLGASAVGLVGHMPSGPGPIPDDLIRKIATTVPPPVIVEVPIMNSSPVSTLLSVLIEEFSSVKKLLLLTRFVDNPTFRFDPFFKVKL